MAAKKARKGKHPGGRPTVITPKVVQKLAEAFKDDFTVEEACRYAGIGTVTYYAECKRNPKFLKEMEHSQDYPLVLAKKRLFRGIQGPGAEAAALALKFLERRQKERYTPKIIQQHEGELAVTYADLEGKKASSPEEAMKMAEELEIEDDE